MVTQNPNPNIGAAGIGAAGSGGPGGRQRQPIAERFYQSRRPDFPAGR